MTTLSLRPLPTLLAAVLLAACQRQPAPAPVAPTPDAAGFVKVDWPLPASDGAGQPDLAVGATGQLLLSWVRPLGGRHALQYAAYLGNQTWESAPRTIAVGSTLSANWANTPHIAQTPDGALWAQWVQAHAGGPAHAADVMLARSADGGMHWVGPVAVNTDGLAAEHGFASLWPEGLDALGVAWLDGRHASGDAGHAAGHAAEAAATPAGGAMSLRAAIFDGSLARRDEAELDPMTCDCCGTAAARAGDGVVLAYRDRQPGEIRDIAVVRHGASGWSSPMPVHADGWKMPGCPVNGPALDASGEQVVVAWYSAAGGQPLLQLARSRDGGATFDAPVVVDRGVALQGRVALALEGSAAWLVWVREDGTGQTLQIARDAGGGAPLQHSQLVRLQGRGRATGSPKIAVRAGIAHVVYTDVVAGQARLGGMRVTHPDAQKAAPR